MQWCNFNILQDLECPKAVCKIPFYDLRYLSMFGLAAGAMKAAVESVTDLLTKWQLCFWGKHLALARFANDHGIRKTTGFTLKCEDKSLSLQAPRNKIMVLEFLVLISSHIGDLFKNNTFPFLVFLVIAPTVLPARAKINCFHCCHKY